MMILKRLAIFLPILILPTKVLATDITLDCLTKNIYFEAKNQSIAGQLAVALVVMNRVKDSRYPSTVCEVIYEGPQYESWKTKQIPDLPKEERKYYPRRDRCQFSWYCDGKSDVPRNLEALAKAELAARQVLRGRVHDFTQNATHYHADYVNPKWAKTRTFIVQIGNHLFYK